MRASNTYSSIKSAGGSLRKAEDTVRLHRHHARAKSRDQGYLDSSALCQAAEAHRYVGALGEQRKGLSLCSDMCGIYVVTRSNRLAHVDHAGGLRLVAYLQRHYKSPTVGDVRKLNRLLRRGKDNLQQLGVNFHRLREPLRLVSVSDSAFLAQELEGLAMRGAIILLA